MNAFLMYGYFVDPYHIAMYLCSGFVKSSVDDYVVSQRRREMSLEYTLDVLLTINIVIKCLTSYQLDVHWEKSIFKIFANYATGTMLFDITSTVPALFLDQND